MKRNKQNKQDIKKTVKMHRHSRLIKSIFATLVFIIILIGAITVTANHISHWSHHTITHLETSQRVKTISTDSRMLNNKKINGKYTIYFYMDNCPHCEHAIPRAYVHNRLSPSEWFQGSHLQYRDIIGHMNNVNLAQDVHVTEVPTKVQMTFVNGKPTHIHKEASLY